MRRASWRGDGAGQIRGAASSPSCRLWIAFWTSTVGATPESALPRLKVRLRASNG